MASRRGAMKQEMIASYQVSINGFPEVRSSIQELDNAIALLRKATLSGSTRTATAAVPAKTGAVFAQEIDRLEGRVKSATQKAMAKSMAFGKRTQSEALRAATTKTGLSGRPAGRKGPGREVTGDMINSIRTQVETLTVGKSSLVTGWHGWPGGDDYFGYQEIGTRGRTASGKSRAQARRKLGADYGSSGHVGGGIKPANSLGSSIIKVREHLKAEIRRIK